jgi:hypothetical protein
MLTTSSKKLSGQTEIIGSVFLVVIMVLLIGSISGYYYTQSQSETETPYAQSTFETYEDTVQFSPSNTETIEFIEFTITSFERGERILIIYDPEDNSKDTLYRYFGPNGEEWKTSKPSPPNPEASPSDELRFPNEDTSKIEETGPRLETGDQFRIVAEGKGGTEKTVQVVTYDSNPT